MKIGVKIYNEERTLDYFKDKADFCEVQAIHTNKYNFLKKYSIPIIIHAEHFSQGSNPADKNMKKHNLKSLNFAIKIADSVNAKKIILHPGALANKNCSVENSIEFVKDIKDKRISIENLVPIEERLLYSPDKMKEFLKQTNKKFCFDLGHAILTAKLLKLNPKKIVKDFLKLKPSHFHINGIKGKKDHFSFKDNKVDLKPFLKLYPKNAEITLEVPTDIKSIEYDLEYIREIVKNL